MGDMVIVALRPKAGQEAKMLELLRGHVPLLRRLGLVTDRPALAMQASNGVVIEVFEWNTGAIEAAHENAEIGELWEEFDRVCEYIPLSQLPESKDMFAQFRPIDL